MNDKANEVLDQLVEQVRSNPPVGTESELDIVKGIEMAREALNDLDFDS